ncbi:MAG: transcription-repair coupling factor [Planctomycetota bacterium]|nr:transcription-repair coupling factor [Planctomycetota bacterium]
MKPQRPKAKRTLADFLNRKEAPQIDFTIADESAPVESSSEVLPLPPKSKATAKKIRTNKLSDQPIDQPNGPTKSSASKVTRKKSVPEHKPEIDPLEKQRLREAQIQEAKHTAKPDPTTRRETQARELLQGITGLEAFRDATDRWARGSSICWEGAWLGAVAPMAAGAVQRFRRPMLVILAQHQDAETVARDLDFFLDRNCDVFPPSSDDIDVDSLQQQEVIQRLQVLSRLDACQTQREHGLNTKTDVPVIVTTIPALMHRVPSPQQLRQDRRSLSVGQRVDLTELKRWLTSTGYRTTTSVQLPGEFTARGGILDVYPPDCGEPRRIEWFDEEVESIRSFDSVTQRSLNRMDRVDLIAANEAIKEEASLLDYLPKDTMVLLSEPIAAVYNANAFKARVPFPERFRDPNELYAEIIKYAFAQITQLAGEGYLGELLRVPIGDVQRIGGELENIAKDIDNAIGARSALIACINEGELSRLSDLLQHSKAFQEGRVKLELGLLSSGFELQPDGPFVLTVNQLLKRSTLRRSSRRLASRAIDSFLDLREGDLVVHLSHGIGIYQGMELIEKQGQKFEHLTIEFEGGTKLYVPSSKIDLVQRYVGATKSRPKLARIGSQAWVRQKIAAEKAVTDMAADLLELQAQRKHLTGIAFKPDSVWQSQFDGSFPYEETPDQLTAIAATKADMMSVRPMERLICGDVGFGKTEVAMRAAFKAVESGYQVAVLVPTTVLAEQHYKTFQKRMAEFPFEIAKLSRFETSAEQKETVRRLAHGQVDIVIGTHRLASADVQFFNLGLLIIDEEQKFGVELKERIKKTASMVDILTLSATPIPRTLHMSLLGVRDISNLETAPEERMAVETRVVRFDDALVRNAILRELNRDGQIFFVHNRIEDMHSVAARLQRIAPEARILIGHGQMAEGVLEQVMLDFIDHRADILLATTIIESGLDIPNANTIFIDEANRYGLSELHQLRGRVGRYKHQAHCYLLVDRDRSLNPDAARRLHAIEEYSQLGAGFGIAMRDLEIRGAGNLLGTQQSGHIATVGYELYCQLLEGAVRQLTRQPPKIKIDVEVNLPIEAFLSSEYIPEMRHKIDVYRRLSRLQDVHAIAELRQELADRFGPLPEIAGRLLDVAVLRMDAALWSIRYIGVEDDYIAFTYSDVKRIEQLARKHNGKLRIVDGQHAYWPLRAEVSKSVGKPQSMSLSRIPLSSVSQTTPIAETNAQVVARTDLLTTLRSVLSPGG